jgi:multisubunit Na+/H+ antiporter MnhC subunit
LLLTAIVISLGSYCLILGMINVSANRFESVDSHEVDQLKG